MKKIGRYGMPAAIAVVLCILLTALCFALLPCEWRPVAQHPSGRTVLAQGTCCDCHYYLLDPRRGDYTERYYSKYPFDDGLTAQRCSDDAWGKIGSEGEVLVPFEFARLIPKNKVPFLLAQSPADSLWQIVDHRGRPVGNRRYKAVDVAQSGEQLYDTPYFVVSEDSLRFGVIAATAGHCEVIPPRYDSVKYAGNRFYVYRAGLCGKLSTDGQEILPVQYSQMISVELPGGEHTDMIRKEKWSLMAGQNVYIPDGADTLIVNTYTRGMEATALLNFAFKTQGRWQLYRSDKLPAIIPIYYEPVTFSDDRITVILSDEYFGTMNTDGKITGKYPKRSANFR